MAGQGDLFTDDPHKLAARTDPATSRTAAAGVVASGRLSDDRAVALAAVTMHPGSTVPELARKTVHPGEDREKLRQKIGRRMNELEKAGLIERAGVREGCTIWLPTKGESS